MVGITGTLNLIGDLFLILNCKMGTVGAAMATSISQYVAAAFFLFYLRKNQKEDNGIKLKWKGLPKMSTLSSIMKIAGVLLARSCVIMLSYTSMTSLANGLGTTLIAAHQVALQTFWFLSCTH